MHTLAWRTLGGVSFAVWIWLACFRGRFWQLRERLLSAVPLRPDTSVTAAIPARDEAELVGRAVASLKAQQFSGALRIVVADDQSADGTANFARAAGADRVVSVAPRPAGWKGKLWAVASGIQAEAPDYFLLTDADIEYASPEILSSLVAKAESGFDLVSVMVRLRAESAA